MLEITETNTNSGSIAERTAGHAKQGESKNKKATVYEGRYTCELRIQCQKVNGNGKQAQLRQCFLVAINHKSSYKN